MMFKLVPIANTEFITVGINLFPATGVDIYCGS